MTAADEVGGDFISSFEIVRNHLVDRNTVDGTIRQNDRDSVFQKFFHNGAILVVSGRGGDIDDAGDALVDEPVGMMLSLAVQVKGIAQDELAVVFDRLVAGPADDFDAKAAFIVMEDKTYAIAFAGLDEGFTDKRSEFLFTGYITFIGQILYGVFDGGAGKIQVFAQLFFGGNFFMQMVNTLIDLFFQPDLELKVLGYGTFFINDH